ncbi:MAG: 3-phosphoshikimate 1-carboxyvinyltransferase, partial [candidate division Zixibacteria bacterium]
TAFLDHLKACGCTVAITNKETLSGELRGDVTLSGRASRPRRMGGGAIVGLIDEIPILAVVAAFADGTTMIRDAAELRVKESDRLQAIAENLERMGVTCGLLPDGLAIEGRHDLSGGDFVSHGDHRIAMAFSIAAQFLDGPSTIDDADCVDVSCPSFYELLGKVVS